MSDLTTSCCRERGLAPIISEYIEPYLTAMLSVELENLQYSPTEEQLQEAKQNLKGVERFISRFGGLHSRIAISNVYDNFYRMTLDDVHKFIEEYEKNTK